MSAHTLGPWRVGDAGHTVFGPPNGKPSPECIADVSPRRPAFRANARLIAAAPDLLAACSLALDLIRDQWPAEHGDAQVGAAWAACERAIRSAGGNQ